MTFSEYINELSSGLKALYPADEATAVAFYYIEELLSLSRNDILLSYGTELGEEQYKKLKEREVRLLNGEPVQYVTGWAWFYGLKYFVNENVLIPRQETEILVDFIVKRYEKSRKRKILDIGTGSGCIPISLKKSFPDSEIFALDISKSALEICRKNQILHNVEFFTEEFDILSESDLPFKHKFDLIISNPPYVLSSEKKMMHKNVVNYEPGLALYVDDSDPLLFYRRILQLINRYIKSDSEIIFEINERFADDIISLNEKYGFMNNQIIRDLNNKNRLIFGYK